MFDYKHLKVELHCEDEWIDENRVAYHFTGHKGND